MRSLRPARCILAVALLVLGACAPIQYTAQEIVLRPHAKADTLDVLILYGGIQSTKPDATASFVESVAKGRRNFMFFDWFLHIDLEEWKTETGKKPVDPRLDAFRTRGLACIEGIQVVGSGYYADEQGRTSMYQHLRVLQASRLFDHFNEALHLAVEGWAQPGELARALPLLDEPTLAAWKDLAARRTRWLSLGDDGIDVRLPMTPRSAARLLSAGIEDVERDPEGAPVFAALARPLSTFAVAEGQVHLRWPTTRGLLAFRVDRSEQDYDASFAEALRAERKLPEKLPTRGDVLKLLGGP